MRSLSAAGRSAGVAACVLADDAVLLATGAWLSGADVPSQATRSTVASITRIFDFTLLLSLISRL
jgi:hypothetical protein